jgi:hypothetical protein
MHSSLRRAATACCLIAGLNVTSAWAAPLAPVKPSGVVTLASDGTTCAGSGLLVNTRILPDGTTTPFTIPAKQVLVITEVEWGVIDVPVSQTFDFYLFLTTTPATALPLVASSALADATGHAGTTTQVSNAIVKAGPSLCAVDYPGSSSLFLVRGFLAKDK